MLPTGLKLHKMAAKEMRQRKSAPLRANAAAGYFFRALTVIIFKGKKSYGPDNLGAHY